MNRVRAFAALLVLAGSLLPAHGAAALPGGDSVIVTNATGPVITGDVLLLIVAASEPNGENASGVVLSKESGLNVGTVTCLRVSGILATVGFQLPGSTHGFLAFVKDGGFLGEGDGLQATATEAPVTECPDPTDDLPGGLTGDVVVSDG